jgi:hypothetical protein
MLADAVPCCETATPVAKRNVIKTTAETDRSNSGIKRVTSGKVSPKGRRCTGCVLHHALSTDPNRAFDIEVPSFEAELIFEGVRLERFELPTLGSVDRCSNPLSYSRVVADLPS